MVLDPLFLYGASIAGVTIIPAMGIKGIALATVLVQVLGAILVLRKIKRDAQLPQRLSKVKLQSNCFKEIIYYGLPSFFQLLLVSIGLSVVTFFLFLLQGNDATAAYGIGLRIEQMALIPSFGFGVALSALVGQNNGAKQYKRIKQSFAIALLFAFLLLLNFMLPLSLFGRLLTGIFTTRIEVIQITETYLFFALIAFMGYQVLNLSQGVLTGMKKPKIAMLIIVIRQLVLPFISLPIFVYTFHMGMLGVFTAIVVNVWICALLMYFFANRLVKQHMQHNERDLEATETVAVQDATSDV
ncbi:uncharacterized protein LOC132563233 [Ylistrum balloti]|uniref:uncharacterized protein LOC132563233 n=1 Tax=Ylistrum balloti TaxID=509963 RepID=UPI00290584D9|nr:uncharacterized protein LOC132563233 [Ylistrum balloti]